MPIYVENMLPYFERKLAQRSRYLARKRFCFSDNSYPVVAPTGATKK
jgi:hypothetical protein